MHLFGNVVTAQGVAANNRGENEGNVSTLQKIIRNGVQYTTVSAEAIRYAIRDLWKEDAKENAKVKLNREVTFRTSTWKDREFGEGWEKYIDNDVLGYMHAKKETASRRGVLEITRAVSTTPWPGTLSHNFAQPFANPIGNENPIPYQAEIHDARYQYGFAMTPDALEQDKVLRTTKTLNALQNLGRVAGNHARYLFDFSPEVIVLRWTADPAPRILLCVDENERGELGLDRLVARLKSGDVDPKELIVGTAVESIRGTNELRKLGAIVHGGVKAAIACVLASISADMQAAQ
jgi:CRISPR-associated protein Cst2